MEIHKSYWIDLLMDPNESRIKQAFVRDLGFESAEPALDYLKKAPQTTFVGAWFLTDEELAKEKAALEENKLSVFNHPYPRQDGKIIVMDEDVKQELEDVPFIQLSQLFSYLATDYADELDIFLLRLQKILSWATDLNEKKEHRRKTCEVFLELTRVNAADPTIVLVLLELMGLFIVVEEASQTPPPFYVGKIGEA